jgi:hypothetical protein
MRTEVATLRRDKDLLRGREKTHASPKLNLKKL